MTHPPQKSADLQCEARRYGDEICPVEAAYWVYIDMPMGGGERAVCGEHAGLLLIKEGPKHNLVRHIEPIGEQR